MPTIDQLSDALHEKAMQLSVARRELFQATQTLLASIVQDIAVVAERNPSCPSAVTGARMDLLSSPGAPILSISTIDLLHAGGETTQVELTGTEWFGPMAAVGNGLFDSWQYRPDLFNGDRILVQLSDGEIAKAH